MSIIRAITIALMIGCSTLTYTLLASSTRKYTYSGDLSLDVSRIPFSRYGSYIGFSDLTQSQPKHSGLYLRNFHGGAKNAFHLDLVLGRRAVPFVESATSSVLHLEAKEGSVDICFEHVDRLRFRGRGVGLRLTAEPGALATQQRQAPTQWEVNGAGKYLLWPIKGELQMDVPWNGTSNGHVIATYEPSQGDRIFEGEIDTYKSVWEPHDVSGDFDSATRAVKQEYSDWLKRMPEVSQEYGLGAELAAYVNWESVVAPEGHLAHPAMLMSKNWMTSVWSWDQCFNAMALSFKDPKLAWDQYMLPIDNQDVNGAFPDRMNDQSDSWDFTKPPIHGWVLSWMLRNGSFNNGEHLTQVYEPLARWTNWYFQFRDQNKDGLPEYRHGNDSGWDNSTAMLSGVPVETPDLDAFLILQMDTLAKVAHTLGKEKDAIAWKSRSDQLLSAMLKKLWKVDHFVGVRSVDGADVESETLLLYLPLILGKRLPADVQKKLLDGLMKKGRFLTENGFATEALTSKYYTPDGYWRGPIWAPATMLLAEGLDSIDRRQVADNIRTRFCNMVQKGGMSENFDAITGTGLRDPAYTWTSSVYLIFAHELFVRHSEAGHG